MKNTIIKTAAIHDLSGLGRCSLSVILPVMSAMGIQVCPVPTAVMSTHTGGYDNFVMRDLTDYIIPSLNHYKQLGVEFDCIYSGFLASAGQIDCCLEFISSYKNALKVIDPVMADNGKPYKTYTPKLCRRMTELVRKADIITPNITEAAILLGEDPSFCPLSASELKSMLVRLSELGPRLVVITSTCSGSEYCNAGYDRDNSKFWKVPYTHVNAAYPGTGDAFTAVLTASLLKGSSLPIAMNKASAFLELAIKTTYSYNTDHREGIMIEQCLDFLTENTNLCGYEIL